MLGFMLCKNDITIWKWFLRVVYNKLWGDNFCKHQNHSISEFQKCHYAILFLKLNLTFKIQITNNFVKTLMVKMDVSLSLTSCLQIMRKLFSFPISSLNVDTYSMYINLENMPFWNSLLSCDIISWACLYNTM